MKWISLEFDPYLPWQRGMLRGIEAYARGVPEWRLLRHRMLPLARVRLENVERRVDGLISSDSLEWAQQEGIPAVRFGARDAIPGIPVVRVDYVEVGRLAARNLIDNGYPRVGFLRTNRPAPQDAIRSEGFLNFAEERGVAAEVIDVPFDGAHSLLENTPGADAVVERIKAMEKPVGMFARNLAEAYVLHSLIEQAGLSIPDDIGLIAGGNDREMLESLQPPLTSVSRNSFRIGYVAAALLKGMLDGEEVDALTLVRPAGIVDRGSTRLQVLGDAVVERARSIIRRHVGQSLEVDAVAREVGVSGRSLRRRFQAALRHTPVREIQLVRLERARDLLENSRASVLEVAERCGFAESCQLSTFFKSETGMTPTEFRGRGLRERAGQRA